MPRFFGFFYCFLGLVLACYIFAPLIAYSDLPVIPSLPVLKPALNATSSSQSSTQSSSILPKANKTKNATYISSKILTIACYKQIAKKLNKSVKKLIGKERRTCNTLVKKLTKGKKRVLPKNIPWLKNVTINYFEFNQEAIDSALNKTALFSNNVEMSGSSSSSTQNSSNASSNSSQNSSQRSSQSSSSSSTQSSSNSSSNSSSTGSTTGTPIKLLVYDAEFNEYDRDFVNGSSLQPFETLCFRSTSSIVTAKFTIGNNTLTDTASQAGSLLCAAGKNSSLLVPLELPNDTYTIIVQALSANNAVLGSFRGSFTADDTPPDDS